MKNPFKKGDKVLMVRPFPSCENRRGCTGVITDPVDESDDLVYILWDRPDGYIDGGGYTFTQFDLAGGPW